MDRWRGRVGRALGVSEIDRAAGADSGKVRCRDEWPHRWLFAFSPGARKPHAVAGSSAAYAHPPGIARSDRSTANAGGRGRVYPGPVPRRLRAAHRPAAGVSRFRRADELGMAGGSPLRGQQRLPGGRRADDVALAGLGRERVQPRAAVRPVHALATGGRSGPRSGVCPDSAYASCGHTGTWP